MSKIAEHNSYSIDDLVTTWKSGWQHLPKFANLQYPHKLKDSGDETKSPLERIHLVVKDVLTPYGRIGKYLNIPKTLPDNTVILNLAASSNRTVYKPVKLTSILGGYPLGSWAKDKVKLHKSLQKVTSAFAISADYEQAFSQIATKNNVKRFKEHWSQQDCLWAKGEYLSDRIEPCLKKMMHHLENGLNSKKECQKAWWNCLWLFMEPTVLTMLDIRKRINADTPLYQEQIEILSYYISHGYPDIYFRQEDNDKHKLQIILKPHTPKMILNSPFEVMTVILLVQPAFDLAQKLQNTFSESRFQRYCHAPSCGKPFYTQYKRQVVCGGGRGNKKTKCALEWKKFRYWLTVLDKNPEQDWNNPRRKSEFLSRNY